MAAQAAALDYTRYASYGAGSTAAVPAEEGYYGPAARPREIPAAIPAEVPGERTRAKPAATPKSTYSLSLFAIVGTAFVMALMLFVVLANISYVEATNETVKLEARIAELTAEERKLQIEYEQTFNMNEIERYAVDVLGMTKPESEQVSVMRAATEDRAQVLEVADEGGIKGIGSFLSSLLAYFK